MEASSPQTLLAACVNLLVSHAGDKTVKNLYSLGTQQLSTGSPQLHRPGWPKGPGSRPHQCRWGHGFMDFRRSHGRPQICQRHPWLRRQAQRGRGVPSPHAWIPVRLRQGMYKLYLRLNIAHVSRDSCLPAARGTLHAKCWRLICPLFDLVEA